jgi:hypothetical protein
MLVDIGVTAASRWHGGGIGSRNEENKIASSRPSLSRHNHQLRDVKYFRFRLSLRDIEELLFGRGVIVSYETVRCWCDKFGAGFAYRLKSTRRKRGSTWHLDEVFVTLRGGPY